MDSNIGLRKSAAGARGPTARSSSTSTTRTGSSRGFICRTRAWWRWRTRRLGLDRHAPPEGDVTGDLFRGFLGGRVVPRRIAVDRLCDDDVVVARGALPAADGVRRAVAEMLPPDRLGRKIVVAFDDDRRVALREDRAVHRARA